jgi:hypothetical protein
MDIVSLVEECCQYSDRCLRDNHNRQIQFGCCCVVPDVNKELGVYEVGFERCCIRKGKRRQLVVTPMPDFVRAFQRLRLYRFADFYG